MNHLLIAEDNVAVIEYRANVDCILLTNRKEERVIVSSDEEEEQFISSRYSCDLFPISRA